jgi:glycerol-3-phosphate dehydrogenase
MVRGVVRTSARASPLRGLAPGPALVDEAPLGWLSEGGEAPPPILCERLTMAVFAVVGAGMMGSALTLPLVDRGHEVRLVGTHLDVEIVESLRLTGVHPKLGLELPRNIRPFGHEALGDALSGADVVALGVSSAGIDWAALAIGPHLRPGVPIFMITKGLSWDNGELRVLPDVLRDRLPAALSEGLSPMAIGGPCIAGELARRVPSCVVLTGRDRAALVALEAMIATDYYHVLTSTDVVGVEACAALKNAYAMGVAFATGLHDRRGGQPGSVATHNLESAVFARRSGRCVGSPATSARPMTTRSTSRASAISTSRTTAGAPGGSGGCSARALRRRCGGRNARGDARVSGDLADAPPRRRALRR